MLLWLFHQVVIWERSRIVSAIVGSAGECQDSGLGSIQTVAGLLLPTSRALRVIQSYKHGYGTVVLLGRNEIRTSRLFMSGPRKCEDLMLHITMGVSAMWLLLSLIVCMCVWERQGERREGERDKQSGGERNTKIKWRRHTHTEGDRQTDRQTALGKFRLWSAQYTAQLQYCQF